MANRKYRTRGARKTRRKNPKKKFKKSGRTIVFKTKGGGGAAKMLLILGLIGGGGYALYHYRDKLGIKLPWGSKSVPQGEPGSELRALQDEAIQVKGMMADSLAAGDNTTYVSLQNRLELINLQIDAEVEL